MHVQLSKGLSLVTDTEKTLYIDYRNGVIYNKPQTEGKCAAFDMRVVDDSFVAAQTEIYGELQTLEQTSHGSNESLTTYKMMQGPRALLTKGVGDSSMNYFGLDFYPGFIKYLVNHKHEDYKKILEISMYNKSVAGINPLVELIEPSHLVQRFTGVVLEKQIKGERTVFIYTFENENTLRDRMISTCY